MAEETLKRVSMSMGYQSSNPTKHTTRLSSKHICESNSIKENESKGLGYVIEKYLVRVGVS